MTSPRVSLSLLLCTTAWWGCGPGKEEPAKEPPPAQATAPEPAPAEPAPAEAVEPAPLSQDEACGRVVVVAHEGVEDVPEGVKRTKEQAAERADLLLSRARGGESMEALAQESDEERSKKKRGGMGTFTREDWPERYAPLMDPIFSVGLDEFTKVVETPLGLAFAQRCAVDKVHARHLLVRYQGAERASDEVTRSKDEARARAQEALAAIESGRDFAEVAAEYGEDGSAERGGDLGEVGRGMFVTPFEELVFGLKEGEVGPLLETPFGFHIVERLPPLAKGTAPGGGSGLHAISVTDIDGKEVSLGDYAGKVVLVVNTASECGFTSQYEDLQKLHAKYGDQGLAILGFPSNDFGGQEPGDEAQIKSFVTDNYGVQFPMFSKVKTKGEGQSELYRFLTEGSAEPFQGEVKWNFTKFLVDRDGTVVSRFESKVDPDGDEISAAVETLLGAG